MKKTNNKWWMWRSWLTRQFVALETVGSSPIFHPIKILGCSQAVRHQTLTLACVCSNPTSPAIENSEIQETVVHYFSYMSNKMSNKLVQSQIMIN